MRYIGTEYGLSLGGKVGEAKMVPIGVVCVFDAKDDEAAQQKLYRMYPRRTVRATRDTEGEG